MTPHCAATTFRISDMTAALDFYQRALGFALEWQSPDYSCLSFGKALLHLATKEVPHSRSVGQGAMYVFGNGVDAYHTAISARGAKPLTAPQDYPYGLRDFTVADPDGNILTFGQELKT